MWRRNANGQTNLRYGLETHTWGFRQDRPEYHDDLSLVVFGSGHEAGGPRAGGGQAQWWKGSLDLIVSEMTKSVYEGTSPHWPNEFESGSVIYPWRFGHVPLGSVNRISMAPQGQSGLKGPRRCAIRGSSTAEGSSWNAIWLNC